MTAPRVELFSLPGNCFIYEADLNDKLIHYAHDKLIQVSLKHAITERTLQLVRPWEKRTVLQEPLKC